MAGSYELLCEYGFQLTVKSVPFPPKSHLKALSNTKCSVSIAMLQLSENGGKFRDGYMV